MKVEELAVIKARVEGLASENWYYDGETICETAQGNPVITANNWGDILISRVVGEFIANARQDVPKLVAEVERLQAILSECESLLRDSHDILDDVHCYETDTYVAITKYFYGDDEE